MKDAKWANSLFHIEMANVILHDIEFRFDYEVYAFFIATVSISLLSLHKWKNVANEKGFEKISSFKSLAGGKICRNQN